MQQSLKMNLINLFLFCFVIVMDRIDIDGIALMQEQRIFMAYV